MVKGSQGFVFRGGVGFAAFLCSGCSFLFTTAPPSHAEQLPPEAPIECTTTRAAPVVDTVIAGLQAVRTVAAASVDDSVYADPDQPLSRGADIGIGLGFTALFTAAAIYGYSVTNRCEEVKDASLERLRERERERERESIRAPVVREPIPTPPPAAPDATLPPVPPVPEGTAPSAPPTGSFPAPAPSAAPPPAVK